MKITPKVVFDTNVYISALLFGGNPSLCLELSRSGVISLFVGHAILFEFASKMQKKFLWEEYKINVTIQNILQYSTLVKPSRKITVIKDDPPDNHVLEIALEARADFIISGDKKHILSLKEFEGIKIVSALGFLKIFYGKQY